MPKIVWSQEDEASILAVLQEYDPKGHPRIGPALEQVAEPQRIEIMNYIARGVRVNLLFGLALREIVADFKRQGLGELDPKWLSLDDMPGEMDITGQVHFHSFIDAFFAWDDTTFSDAVFHLFNSAEAKGLGRDDEAAERLEHSKRGANEYREKAAAENYERILARQKEAQQQQH